MSRQYFADVLVDPIGVSHPTIATTSITSLIPTAYAPIPAFDPRAGKVYELTVGGSFTSGATGTILLTADVGSVRIGTSSAQLVVPSVSLAPFLFRGHLIYRGPIGLAGANCPVVFNGKFESAGNAATASSHTSVYINAGPISVDPTIAAFLNIQVTLAATPSIIPFFSVWRSLN